MKNDKTPHLLCMICGYVVLSFIILFLSSIAMCTKFIFSNIEAIPLYLLASYVLGVFIYKTSK